MKINILLGLLILISPLLHSLPTYGDEMLDMREFTTYGAPETKYGSWHKSGERVIREVIISFPKTNKIQKYIEVYYGGKTGRIDRLYYHDDIDLESQPLSPRY